MKQFLRILGAALGLAVFASVSSAATTIFTDRTAFDIATGGSLTFEDFNDGVLDGVGVATDAGGVVNGVWRDRPTTAGASTTFTFGGGITSFGADFDLSPGGAGTGLRFTLDGNEVVAEEVIGTYSGFFGFISDASFSTILVESGSSIGVPNGFVGVAETHTFDNLSFGTPVTLAPVPLPAGLSLILAALGAVFGLRLLGRGKTVLA